jgi:hypothetical protein
VDRFDVQVDLTLVSRSRRPGIRRRLFVVGCLFSYSVGVSMFRALWRWLVSYDLQDLYLRAKPHIRRLMNQAIFEAICIGTAEEVRFELASPVKNVHAIKDELDPDTKKAIRRVKAKTRKHPEPDERIPVGPGAAENDEVPRPMGGIGGLRPWFD